MLVPLLGVIWTFDGLIRPPGPKMVVCVEPSQGFYFRINSKGDRPGSVLLTRQLHPFLDHDSYLECNGPLEFDDYVVEKSINDRGIIGHLDRGCASAIVTVVSFSQRMPKRDIQAIHAALTS